MRKLVALLAVLSMVGMASAGITVSGNTVAEGVDLGNGLRAYTVTLTFDQPIYAMDFKFTGPLNQTAAGSQTSTPDCTNYILAQYGIWDMAKDSHFLVNGDRKGVIFDPEKGMILEDATSLTGVFGSGSGFTSSFELAYIVLPEGERAVASAAFGANPTVADNTGIKTEIASFVVGVPEPATLGLLAMGVVGLLRKRTA